MIANYKSRDKNKENLGTKDNRMSIKLSKEKLRSEKQEMVKKLWAAVFLLTFLWCLLNVVG